MKYNVWLAMSFSNLKFANLKHKYSISNWNITCTLMNSITFGLKGAAKTWHHNDLNWTWQLEYYHCVVYSQDCFVAKTSQYIDQLLSVKISYKDWSLEQVALHDSLVSWDQDWLIVTGNGNACDGCHFVCSLSSVIIYVCVM